MSGYGTIPGDPGSLGTVPYLETFRVGQSPGVAVHKRSLQLRNLIFKLYILKHLKEYSVFFCSLLNHYCIPCLLQTRLMHKRYYSRRILNG